MNSLSLQEITSKYANTTLSKLNEAALEKYGVDVMWFRSIPQKRSTDVIFQTYTLHNVEECPLNIKVMYSDSSYDDAALTFAFNGIEYKPSLTLEIPVNSWKKATDYDGSIPQKLDIVFVPQTKKLWQVATMTPVSSMGGQVTSYKMMMETYAPMASRLVTGKLEESIDNHTVSVDKLFGKAISDVMEDLTDDKQLSQFSSTIKDEYKDVTRTPSKHVILEPDEITNIISGNIEVDGHIAARSYYNMDIPMMWSLIIRISTIPFP